MTVAGIIKHRLSPVITATELDDFQSLSEKLALHNIGALIVLDSVGGLGGIVSERDLVRAVAERKQAVFAATARDMMTKKVFVCTPDESDTQVMLYMVDKHIRHMPVVEDGKVVGMVSLADAVRHRLIKIRHLFEEVSEEDDSDKRLGIFSQHLRTKPEPKEI